MTLSVALFSVKGRIDSGTSRVKWLKARPFISGKVVVRGPGSEQVKWPSDRTLKAILMFAE
jgi:hypothetical protein